jgi:transposase
MTIEGMGPTLAVEEATIAVVFEAYVEWVLTPSLRAGQIVVMDKLGAHRPKRIRELIEERGCELLYLPSYSPDYNLLQSLCLAALAHHKWLSDGRSDFLELLTTRRVVAF